MVKNALRLFLALVALIFIMRYPQLMAGGVEWLSDGFHRIADAFASLGPKKNA